MTKFENAVRKTHQKIKFGDTYIFRPISPSLENSLLITAGVQGDEPAGWVAMLEWAQSTTVPNNVYMIPIMSVESYENGSHYDHDGENTNHNIPKNPSNEMENILDNEKELKKMTRGGFLSLQEDPNRSEGYLFIWKDNSDLSSRLLDIMSSHFQIYEDGILGLEDDQGMFGEYAVRTLNTPNAYTTETPVLENSLEKRVKAQVEIIRAVVESIA